MKPGTNTKRHGRAWILWLVVFVALVAAVSCWCRWVYIEIETYANQDQAATADAIGVFGAAEYDGRPSPVYRARLDHAAAEFHVGNLYLNRKCTGAMVGAHPFGGFNMSGTDSKAGGPDYLLLFTQAKSVAEKL